MTTALNVTKIQIRFPNKSKNQSGAYAFADVTLDDFLTLKNFRVYKDDMGDRISVRFPYVKLGGKQMLTAVVDDSRKGNNLKKRIKNEILVHLDKVLAMAKAKRIAKAKTAKQNKDDSSSSSPSGEGGEGDSPSQTQVSNEQKARLQAVFTEAKNVPMFAPVDGVCYKCKKNVYENMELGYVMNNLVASCPHCNHSFAV